MEEKQSIQRCKKCGTDIKEEDYVFMGYCEECFNKYGNSEVEKQYKDSPKIDINYFMDKVNKEKLKTYKEKTENYKENVKKALRKSNNKISIVLIIVSAILLIMGIVCLCKAFDLKNNYHMSSSYPTLNKHVYVGGDAYNYIINANYFTGYIVLGSSLFICSAISIAISLLLKNSKERN